jgi:type III secretory pathway lipoprotein EscJ
MHKTYLLLTFISFLMILGCKEEVVHDLDETSVNKILIQLKKSGIKAKKIRQKDESWSLQVTSDESLKAYAVIDRYRMLPQKEPRMDSSLFSSESANQFQTERLISSEIERLIKEIPGTISVKVHIKFEEQHSLFGKKQYGQSNGSGSVVVITDDTTNLEVDTIRRLAASASGLLSDHIQIYIVKIGESLQAHRDIFENSNLRENSVHDDQSIVHEKYSYTVFLQQIKSTMETLLNNRYSSFVIFILLFSIVYIAKSKNTKKGFNSNYAQ